MAERKFAWGPRKENALIGKSIPRIDGVEKASGKAKFTTDINTPGTLYARLLTCKHAHAKVKSLNVDAAKKIPGVRAVHIFNGPDSEIRWDGTLIAAVAADRPEIAQDGVEAIEVEYEVLPHFVDEEDIKAAEEAGRTKPLGKNTKGDVAEALKGAKLVHKGYYGAQTISHMCLEPHGVHCEWKGDDTLDVHLSTQNVSGTPIQFAMALLLDASKVTVTADYEGGGFGSKFAADEWGIACAKLAKETGKPVKLILDRATELKAAGTRPSGFIEVTVGADADGKVVAWDSHHWGTAGPGGGAIPVGGVPYVFDFENRDRTATNLICDTGPTRAWRAPPHPQLCLMTQTSLDDVARKLELDSYDVFMKNLEFTGELAPTYEAEMKIAAQLMDWKKKWHLHGKNAGKGPVKRGLGMAVHTWGGGAGGCKCNVKVHPDGSVETFLGSQDLGTGTRTIIAITLAETFGLPLSAVKVHLGSSKYSASAASGGSITVGGVSGAHRRAGQTALWKIFDLVAKKHNVDADKLQAKDGNILSGADKVCTWKQATSLLGPMPLEILGEGPAQDGLTSARVGGVQMADVSVDTETGIVRMHKFVAVQDCGLILDELTAKSQVYGAVIMGIAYALTEERVMDNASGRYINADLENYKLPRLGDIGEIVVEMYQPDSEYDRGVVGLGEPPVISPGAAISNAVCNALGVRVPVIPLTPQRVLAALKKKEA
jgi:xanthine dehydrogenase YagR molybdenum-binding subunit